MGGGVWPHSGKTRSLRCARSSNTMCRWNFDRRVRRLLLVGRLARLEGARLSARQATAVRAACGPSDPVHETDGRKGRGCRAGRSTTWGGRSRNAANAAYYLKQLFATVHENRPCRETRGGTACAAFRIPSSRPWKDHDSSKKSSSFTMPVIRRCVQIRTVTFALGE
jgi:hypothetical protein